MEVLRSYPNINVDFRKLDRDALLRLVNYFDVKVSPQMSDEEVANTVARIFEARSAPETEVVDKFAAKFCHSQANNSTITRDGDNDVSQSSKKQKTVAEYHHFHPAPVGEQVAAKSTKGGDETDGWILGNIMSYDINRESYEVQDEDDLKRTIKCSFQQVRRLEDSAVDINRGDRVMAVFPETTSFYRATVVKTPRIPASSVNGQWEVVVRFDDDEDESGKWPARRVPARFVLRSNTFPTFLQTEPALER